jgi:hypothetical protein
MVALGSNKKLTTIYRLLWYRDFHRLYGCHPLEGGFFRVKPRKDRRYGMPLENPVSFYARFACSEVKNIGSMVLTYMRLKRILKRVLKDPARKQYRDVSITPPDLNELSLALYSETRGTAAELEKQKRQAAIIKAAREKGAAPVPLAAAE